MIVFVCHVCRTTLSAESTQAGQLVRCPTCLSTLSVPAGQMPPAPPLSGGMGSTYVPPPQGFGAPMRSGGKRYGFNCGYCSSRLEANEAMAAQEGQCPTCGNNITIPILDRYGRLIDPKTRQIIKQDPHPVHAYAAAGERAPGIFRDHLGAQFIKCPRNTCGFISPITANNCKNCGMPFTMEGTTLDASGNSNGFCVASLVLGIIGLPLCFGLPSVLAVIFGIIGLNQVNKSSAQTGGKGMAIAGIVCGSIGCLIFLYWITK